MDYGLYAQCEWLHTAQLHTVHSEMGYRLCVVCSAVLSREEIVLMPAVFCYTFSSSDSVSTQYSGQFQEQREIIRSWTLRTPSTISGHQLGEAREDGALNMWEHSEHSTT